MPGVALYQKHPEVSTQAMGHTELCLEGTCQGGLVGSKNATKARFPAGPGFPRPTGLVSSGSFGRKPAWVESRNANPDSFWCFTTSTSACIEVSARKGKWSRGGRESASLQWFPNRGAGRGSQVGQGSTSGLSASPSLLTTLRKFSSRCGCWFSCRARGKT